MSAAYDKLLKDICGRLGFCGHMGGSEIDVNLAARMDTPEDLRLDREHLAHLLYECRDGRHPATQENEADLQRELEKLDAKIARLTSQA